VLKRENSGALALLLTDNGRFSDALIAVDAAIKGAPEQPPLRMLRGRLLETLGRETEAAAGYRRAWQLDPDNVVSAYLSLSIGAWPDDAASGPLKTLIDTQATLVPPADQRSGLEPIRDLRLIPDRASKTPIFAPAAYAEGFAAMAAGNYVQALARLRTAVARDPVVTDRASQSQAMSMGIARLRTGRFADAISLLEAAVSAHGNSSEAHRIVGTAYAAAGDDTRAVEHLRRAISIAPDDERSRLALARVLRDAGRLDAAAESLRDTLVAMPRSGEARWMLGDVLEKSGGGLEAAREIEAAAATTVIAGTAPILLRAAEIYDRHQEFDRLVTLLERRARLDPNDPAVHRQLGLALSRRGQDDRAFVELAMADLLGGADAESLTTLGQIHLEADRLENAESASRRAIALDGDRADAHYVLGRALLRQARATEAQEELDTFQRLRTAAMEAQRHGFEIDALRAEANSATVAGRHGEAAAMWRRLVERLPLDPDIRAAAAEALAANNEVADAADSFEEAARLGAAPAVYQRLAAIYAQLGDMRKSDQARRRYEERVKELLKVSPPASR
jgi:tetratricopeptide (TPR) repeat protein